MVALRGKNALPSDEDLSKGHDEALSNLFNGQLSGDQAEQALDKVLGQNGLKASFGDVLVRTVELEQAYTAAIKADQAQQAVAELAKQNIPVSVNPRYGAWDPTKFTMSSDPAAGLPSVLRVRSGGAVLPGVAPPSQ